MKLSYTIRLLQFLNHCTLIYFLIWCQSLYSLLWISFLIFQIIIIVGVSSGLHRYFTHKSFKTSIFWEKVMLWVSVPSTLGTPISWIGTHRLHHAYSDKTKDPHSPSILGFFRSYFHIWNDLSIPSALVVDIIKNKTAKLIHQNYLKILFCYIALLYFIDPILGIVIYSIPAVLMFHSTSITNAIGHTFGYRNHNTNDTSTNSKTIALLTGGEGLHNNHHASPNSAKFSNLKYEFDTSWYFIKTIRK